MSKFSVLIAVIALASWLTGCTPPVQAIEPVTNAHALPQMGVLSGLVSKGPLSPLEVPDEPESSAVPGARIRIMTQDGKPVSSVQADQSGHFSVSLAPGTYRVTLASMQGAMFTNDLPATVTIAAGEHKRLDIHLDTGIR